MSKVKLTDVKKIYNGGVVAVHDFNLDIADKEFVVFVGPSGCGKSTTLRMVAGLEEISKGELYIDDTLVNAILFHCGDSLSGINGEKRPGIVHRIDKDTTGALIICKNDHAHISLAEQIKAHTVHRIYKGIVYGNMKEDKGTVDLPLERDRKDRKRMAIARNTDTGRRAVTHYRVLKRFKDYTYMEFSLETGRTHQIRVHMSHIGHPLLGDEVYGPKKVKGFAKGLMGQTLHAGTIGFIHPSTGEYMEFTAPLPEYFEELLKKLSNTAM